MFLEHLTTSQIDSILEAVYLTALGMIIGGGLARLVYWIKNEMGFEAGND